MGGAVLSKIPSPGAALTPSIRNSPRAVLAGSAFYVWGGTADAGPVATGASYDLANNKWTPMSGDGAPSARDSFAIAWTGQELVVWGGFDPNGDMLSDGAVYTP
jgi:hypothetical protein